VVRSLSVREPAARWAREAHTMVSLVPPDRKQASAALAMTRMDQRAAVTDLMEIYAE